MKAARGRQGRFSRDPTHALAAELELAYEPPTANNPDELPDQDGRRYPLMRTSRETTPVLTLVTYLFQLLWWRCVTWSARRRGLE